VNCGGPVVRQFFPALAFFSEDATSEVNIFVLQFVSLYNTRQSTIFYSLASSLACNPRLSMGYYPMSIFFIWVANLTRFSLYPRLSW
jgi:hypothetical protein